MWMKRTVGAAVLALLAGSAWAQSNLPQHTMDYKALAQQVVDQLQLEPGEKVMALAQPAMFEEFISHFRYAVMETVPSTWESSMCSIRPILRSGIRR